MRKTTAVGSRAIARLHDGRVVVAKGTAIVDSVVGRKFHISLGAFALNVDETQIVRETRLTRRVSGWFEQVLLQNFHFGFKHLIDFVGKVSESYGVILNFGLFTEFLKPFFLLSTH
jgi:hypothetical protein